jgi:hypothetical protein
VQDGFLHVHAIFRLIEDNGGWTVENFVCDFRAAMGRKAMHKNGIGSG